MPHPGVTSQLERYMALMEIAAKVKAHQDANPHPEPEYEPMDHDVATGPSGSSEK